MENKVFEANLALIDEYNSELANKLKSLKNYSQTFELTKTQKDEYNLRVNGVDIHSNTGAIDEAKKIVEDFKNLKEENALFVIFGIGLGYLFDETVQNVKGSVILFEPNLEILKCTLEIVDMTEILHKKKVRICCDIEDLKRGIDEFSDKLTKISVSFLTSYYNVYSNKIKEVAQIVEYHHGENAALDNTIRKLGRLSTKNTLLNLANLFDTFFIKEFKNMFKNVPALIVTAGPSLAKNIEIIKNNQNKFVIFCAGPALKLLLENGINPDFAVIVETKNTVGQIEDLDLSKTNLIIEPDTSHYIFNIKTKNKIVFCSQYNFLNDWFANAVKIDNQDLHYHGTVSYCALSSADLMGCNPIVLVGQDLAYTDGKCYAKGSAYENLECKLNEEKGEFEITIPDSGKENYYKALFGRERAAIEIAPKAAENYVEFLNKNLYTVAGQNGEKLPTQTAYAIFIKHFEEFAAQNFKLFGKRNKLINSSTGGAQINGFENIPLSEVVKDIQESENFDKTLSGSDKITSSINFDKENLVKTLNLSQISVQKAFVVIDEINVILEKIEKELKTRKAVTKNIEKLFEKLNERNEFFKSNFFEKNQIIHYTIYASYKCFLEILEKSRINPAQIPAGFEIFFLHFKYSNLCLIEISGTIESAITECEKIK